MGTPRAAIPAPAWWPDGCSEGLEGVGEAETRKKLVRVFVWLLSQNEPLFGPSFLRFPPISSTFFYSPPFSSFFLAFMTFRPEWIWVTNEENYQSDEIKRFQIHSYFFSLSSGFLHFPLISSFFLHFFVTHVFKPPSIWVSSEREL